MSSITSELKKKVPSLSLGKCCNRCYYLDSFACVCNKHKISVYGDWVCDQHTRRKPS